MAGPKPAALPLGDSPTETSDSDEAHLAHTLWCCQGKIPRTKHKNKSAIAAARSILNLPRACKSRYARVVKNTAKTSPRPKIPTLRVLQILPELNEGGVEQSTIDMALFLKSKRIFNTVASAGGWRLPQLTESRIAHYLLPLSTKNPWIIWKNAQKIKEIIIKNKINVVHARSRAPAWSAYLACKKLNNVKFISTFHGTYGSSNIFKRIYNSVMLKGDVTIANSQFIAEHIQNIYKIPKEKIIIAPRGVNTAFSSDTFSPNQIAAIRSELAIPPQAYMLLFAGRLTSWKGQHILLEALAKLSKSLPWVAVFAGGPDKRGIYAADLKGYVKRLKIIKKVRWLGTRQDMPLLNAAADIAFNLSTKPEAFGRTTIEAMAMGTPVVASAHGGSLEIITHEQTGWLVAAQKPQEVATLLRRLLTQPEHVSKIGQQAQQHVLNHFTTEQCCQQEFAAYKKLWAAPTKVNEKVLPA